MPPMSRAFLEEAQRLAGELARAVHAHRRGTAGETERARLDDAVQRMRGASAPLLAILNPEQREAVTEDTEDAGGTASTSVAREAGA